MRAEQSPAQCRNTSGVATSASRVVTCSCHKPGSGGQGPRRRSSRLVYPPESGKEAVVIERRHLFDAALRSNRCMVVGGDHP